VLRDHAHGTLFACGNVERFRAESAIMERRVVPVQSGEWKGEDKEETI
jgi:hypothetical protein